jgi:hypothetical protein
MAKRAPPAIFPCFSRRYSQADGETGWALQLRELLAFAKITRIFGLDAALANLAGVAPAEDRDVVASTLAKTIARSPSAARSDPSPAWKGAP